MTTTRVFKSTDSGAPVLTGQSGSLISLLHACLVGTSGVAYGSGGGAKTAAGWSEPFSNTATKGAWKNSAAAGGTGMCVRVLDDGSGAASFREAFMVSYATMSDIDTGTQLVPATTTAASGYAIRKSTTADSTARSWILIADECTFYLWLDNGDSSNQGKGFYWAGDYSTDLPSESLRFGCGGKNTYNAAGTSSFNSYAVGTSPGVPAAGNCCSIAVDYTQTGGCVLMQPYSILNNSNPGSSAVFPAPPQAGFPDIFANVLVYTRTAGLCIRGRMRGLYVCSTANAGSITSGNTRTPVNFGGNTLMDFAIWGSSSSLNAAFIDISGPWGI